MTFSLWGMILMACLMLLAPVKVTLINAYIWIYCLCLFRYDILCFICVCAICMYVCTVVAHWLAIYRILIGHMSEPYDWLLVYIINTTTDMCASGHVL